MRCDSVIACSWEVQEAAAPARLVSLTTPGTGKCYRVQRTAATQVQVLVPPGELERKRQQKEQQHWAYLNKGREVG